MKFSEIAKLEGLLGPEPAPMNSFQLDLIREYLEHAKRKAEAADRPFEYFYEDVIAAKLQKDFKAYLGPYYAHAAEDARCCLHICDEFRKLGSTYIYSWLQNALQFANSLVMHYIMEIRKENPKKYPNAGTEKSRYLQLMEMGGDMGLVGNYLRDLYNLRNKLEHRTLIREDGSQELLLPQKAKARKVVGKLYPEVLRRLGGN